MKHAAHTACLLLAANLFAGNAQAAANLPTEQRVPGGIALVAVGHAATAPVVEFGRYRAAVIRQDDHWLAIVGLPLATKPGVQQLHVVSKSGTRQVLFTVQNKRYRTQQLHIDNRRQVNPTAEDLVRIDHERARIEVALSNFSLNDHPSFALRSPVAALSSAMSFVKAFGQGKKSHKSPPRSLDIKIWSSTSIPNDSRVCLPPMESYRTTQRRRTLDSIKYLHS